MREENEGRRRHKGRQVSNEIEMAAGPERKKRERKRNKTILLIASRG